MVASALWDRTLALIHPSAWKANSRNFAENVSRSNLCWGYLPAAAPLGLREERTTHSRRGAAMARKKPTASGCEHPFPIEVVPLGDGRRARCLRCGECGPGRPDSEGAMRALKNTAGHRGKIGA